MVIGNADGDLGGPRFSYLFGGAVGYRGYVIAKITELVSSFSFRASLGFMRSNLSSDSLHRNTPVNAAIWYFFYIVDQPNLKKCSRKHFEGILC